MSAYKHPDLFASPVNPGGDVRAEPPEGATERIPLNGITLTDICASERFADLDRHDSYYRAAQDFAKRYDWDGNIVDDPASPIRPGWLVPTSARKPCARYDLGKVIVSRHTAMLFGADRFPEVKVAGDTDTEDYLNGIMEATRLKTRMISVRNNGGAQGSVGVSFAFREGVPEIEVHKAKHVTILEWADRVNLRPRAVLKAYRYPVRVYDPKEKKLVLVDYFYARYWDETKEVVWRPIPASVAKTTSWALGERDEVAHPFGFCPFYWGQNIENDEGEDGLSDFDGLLENLDEVNRLLSAESRAARTNAAPTLVVKADPALNTGHVQKGEGEAIFSPNGAEYLTLGEMKAVRDAREAVRQATLDVANVVAADPEKLSGAAQSAAALRILYAPMTAQADIYRERYGEMMIKPLLHGLLRACIVLEKIGTPAVLPPRVVEIDGEPPKVLERVVGPRAERATISLNWNPYFSPTWPDIKAATEAAKLANGDKPVLSQRSAISAVQSLWGVENVDEELDAIHEDAEKALAQAQATMGLGGPAPAALDGKDPTKPGEPPSLEPPDDDEDEKPIPGGPDA